MSKTLRTPIIKPRQQGGTFYTFGSAMEDIGLNVNENFNRVEMSHYVLLDIPKFCMSTSEVPTSDPDYNYSLVLNTKLPYNDATKYPNRGDFLFAESFQNYCLNMETVVRNDKDYNYASNKTVSERVFWKWLFKKYNKTQFDSSMGYSDKTYYFEHEKPIVKGFGSISAGSQRTDDSGIYNETFVQIPSSYGPMRVLFKKSIDENYLSDKEYIATTPPNIENISEDEIQDNVITSTGISPKAEYDDGYKYKVNYNTYGDFEVVFDLAELRKFYDNPSLTYDDIAMGKVNGGIGTTENTTEYSFNAILVYYSIYNSDKTKRLATNAYGLYILDNSVDYKAGKKLFYFPSLLKKMSTKKENGSSYSFRINVKPTTAYSGDIHVTDNSTEAFSMSEDFNDVVRNLAGAINILKGNAKTLLKIVQDNNNIKQMAMDTMERVDNIEHEITTYKNNTNITSAADGNFNIREISPAIDLDMARVYSLQFKPWTYGNYGQCWYPSFMIITDVHGEQDDPFSWGSIERAFAYAEAECIDTVCLLGDIGQSSTDLESYKEKLENLRLNCSKPSPAVAGNHEFLYYSNTKYVGLSDDDITKIYYSNDMISKNGEIHHMINGKKKNYYYKDVTKNGYTVRLICLYQYEWNPQKIDAYGHDYKGKDGQFYTQEQIDWFVDVLQHTPGNYGVIILSHMAFNNNVGIGNIPFNPYANTGLEIRSYMSNKSFFYSIINAWVNGTSCNVSTNQITTDGVNTPLNVNTTFSGTHKFIANIVGHNHTGGLFKMLDPNGNQSNYMIVCNPCTSDSDYQQSGWHARNRNVDKIRDCINVFIYNFDDNDIKIARLGSDMTHDGREAKTYVQSL